MVDMVEDAEDFFFFCLFLMSMYESVVFVVDWMNGL